MAAFLTVDVLWAHAAPAFPHGPQGQIAWPGPAPQRRPVLRASWQVGPDGRLTCRWQSDVPAPLGPPPH
jgi:hypothetical protein